MAQLFLYGLTGSVCLAALRVPWVGVAFYYLTAILGPQFIWYWVFRDFRAQMYVAVATIAGTLFSLLRGRIDFSILWQKQNLKLLVMCISMNISNMVSEFSYDARLMQTMNPDYLVSMVNKILVFYLVAIFLIDDIKKYKVLNYLFVMIIVYYTYWANNEYFTGSASFMENGRLSGPVSANQGGIYMDENAFAMLFVVGIPYLYFLGMHSRNLAVKAILLCAIPWAWHAIFLTASRMALLGVVVVSAYIAVKSKSKALVIVMCAGFVVALLWQGRALVDRVDYTRAKSAGSASEPVDPRIISWGVGLRMMWDHPVFGVGAGKFISAFSLYSDTRPHVAHNTFLQWGAESGVMSGLMYLLIVYKVLRSGRERPEEEKVHDSFVAAGQNAVRGAMWGFFLCSMFLDLAYFETFYFLIGLHLIADNLSNEVRDDDASQFSLQNPMNMISSGS